MQPLFSTLTLDRTIAQPVYLQLASKLMMFIRDGSLQAGDQLPGTRQMAELLSVHRKTVIRSYDDLLAQGWLESHTGSGTFVARHLPEIKPFPLIRNQEPVSKPALFAGFNFQEAPHLDRETTNFVSTYHLDDGFPDIRLAPLYDLSRAYRTQLLMGNSYNRLGYLDPKGSIWLREELCKHLNVTRSLKCTIDNILILRGSVMGLYLVSTGLLQPGDRVVTGSPGWSGANTNFVQAGACLIQIPVDAYGIQIDDLEQLCKKNPIRMVYVTSHHHYPTTVSLRADRRIQLLRLSVKYGFIIFEDDYDYDFHYQNKPLLPLASADEAAMVLYCGSFTKAIAPAFRVGYIVGSANVIDHLAKLRRIIDRQGDVMLENAMAEMLQNGIIQRHLRKSVRIYRQRRDFLCKLIQTHLSNYIDFQPPEGGMSLWACFDPQIDLTNLSRNARKNDLFLSDGRIHISSLHQHNATRLGFASSNINELERCMEILSVLLKKL